MANEVYVEVCDTPFYDSKGNVVEIGDYVYVMGVDGQVPVYDGFVVDLWYDQVEADHNHPRSEASPCALVKANPNSRFAYYCVVSWLTVVTPWADKAID